MAPVQSNESKGGRISLHVIGGHLRSNLIVALARPIERLRAPPKTSRGPPVRAAQAPRKCRRLISTSCGFPEQRPFHRVTFSGRARGNRQRFPLFRIGGYRIT